MPVELELLAESSFFEQEMRVRLKNADRKMKIILFINQLITKVKYYGLVLGEPNIYHDSGVFYKNWWILLGGCLTVKSVGVTHRG